MALLKKLKQSTKYLKGKDLLAPFIFIAILPVAGFYKLYLKVNKKHLWLFCEGENEARDNGYVLFKYVREQQPHINAHYAINKKSASFNKVASYGNIISFGSLKHWLFYIAATKNISIHKAASPNTPLFYVLHRYRLLNGHRIFLQHGITMNNVNYLHFNETNFELFVCGAKPEYEYIKQTFGYPEGAVQYLGFPRFDSLHDTKAIKKRVVIMPTWRSWLGREVNALGKSESFTESEYYLTYQSLLSNKKFIAYVEANGIEVYFYPHFNMEKYISDFSSKSRNIHIVDSKTSNIQELIATSGLMITDYSSVAMDFAYIGKPVAYYQFDYKKFRDQHLASGYFSYERHGFGPVIKSEEALIAYILERLSKDSVLELKYKKRGKIFFEKKDRDNCKRVFTAIEKEAKV